ncbi:TonB-dependent receptor [Thauera linaloolentis 47Lol = DSM 12138]|uniref:TonB-dependent receptor n=1 Tax=Thauera linaloolentis (strain DSM 12138 / JCM 21573 / CCUG 41526 / CIP 105981 / IAM 15112 / NBRC 102519 / 47Lol) TaxID=1123367 RepID=N6Z8Y7_THAL4|nr:TonB-dependent receptor [Thauera linaloolentis 47Lol = DSM 12138]
MVVSASGFEQDLKEAPASISVVTREELETKQFRDLAEALQDVEGIDVRGSTGKTGGLNISIRGMPSDYTLILIDGRRQNVAGDVTPNGFGDALTSFIPPISAIERIEVIRGPMSTLYGSDAMGGVVNIITRKVAKEWNGSLGVEAGIPQDGDWGASQKINLYANGPIAQDLLGIAVRGSLFQRGETERIRDATGNARDPAPAKTRQHSIGTRLTLTPNASHDIWLDIDQARTWYDNEDCRLGGRDYLNSNCVTANTTVTGYKDYMRLDREQIAIGHSSRLSFGLFESSLMRTTTETKGRTIPTAARPAGSPDIGADRELETVNVVFDTKLVAPLGESHVATVGGQWWDAELTDSLLPDDHEQTMWSLFIEDEWRLTDSLAATLGARYDHHDAFGGEVSPRAYLVWNAASNWTVKGGVSQGFKAPRLNQLIDGISGISGQGTSISIGNPDLKPETSTSTELGILFDNQENLSASATLFHNKIEDKISSGGDCTVNFISSCVANPDATYSINNDEAKTWGIELTSRIVLAPRWSLNLNYTWTDSEVRENGQKNGELSDTAKHIANAQLRWDTTDKLSLWVRGEYRGDSRRFDGDPDSFSGNTLREYQALGDLKGYSLFHLGGSYKVASNVTVNANIFNLFDKDFTKFKTWTNVAGVEQLGSEYYRSAQSTKGTVTAGRTLWISANVNF